MFLDGHWLMFASFPAFSLATTVGLVLQLAPAPFTALLHGAGYHRYEHDHQCGARVVHPARGAQALKFTFHQFAVDKICKMPAPGTRISGIGGHCDGAGILGRGEHQPAADGTVVKMQPYKIIPIAVAAGAAQNLITTADGNTCLGQGLAIRGENIAFNIIAVIGFILRADCQRHEEKKKHGDQ